MAHLDRFYANHHTADQLQAAFFAAAVSAKCFSLICAARSFLFSSFCFSAVASPLALAA